MTNMANISTERRMAAPKVNRTLELQPGSWNAELRTVDVIWTTGARGMRFDWAAGDFVDEELATASGNVRLGRLNNGAPVLNSHRKGDVADQIGVVMPGSARMENGRGIATIQLSDRADLAPIVNDIAAGIIRNLSVGYFVHVFETEQRQGQRPLWRAIDWEPFEISFVTVPFDAAAQVRSAADGALPCIIRPLNPETDMTSPTNHPVTEAPAPQPFAGNAASIATLRSIVTAAAASYNLPVDACAELTLEMVERGLTDAQARETVLHLLAERQRREIGAVRGGPAALASSPTARALVGADQTYDNPTFQGRAIEDALYARMRGADPTPEGREFMGMTMLQIAARMLERQGMRNVNMMDPMDVLNAAAWNRVGSRAAWIHDQVRSGGYHTTSDFPDLLTAAGQRFLMDMFAAAASPLKTIGRRRSARDFRTISGLQLSGFGTLPEVGEGGEIEHGTFNSRKETYAVKSFAKQFALSRQAIINDDLGAFGDPMRIMARAAAETEASLLADLINDNPVLGDGVLLFHADHGNLAGAGAAPDVGTLSAGRLAMRGQKDLDSVTPIAAAPKYILSSPKYETAIEQLVSVPLMPTQVDESNPFAGKLVPLVDPRLEANPWYLFADPSLCPVIEYAYLYGEPGPKVEMRDGWDTFGTAFRVYMDFGAGIIDHRGGFKNPGTA